MPSSRPNQRRVDFASVIGFRPTPEALDTWYKLAEMQLELWVADILSVPAAERDFDNTIGALDASKAEFQEALSHASLLASVSPDKAVREAADAIEEKGERELIRLESRPELYQAVRDYEKRAQWAAPEEKRLLEATLLSFKKAGTHLSEIERGQVEAIENKISALANEFMSNLRENTGFLEADKNALSGLSADFISELKPEEAGQVRIALDAPSYDSVMRLADNPELRRKMESAFHGISGEANTNLLKQTAKLKRELGGLLGYSEPAYPRLALQEQLVSNPDEVWSFLHRVRERLGDKARHALQELLALKRVDDPRAEKIENWDLAYYSHRLRKLRFDIDDESLREHFPANRVVSETMRLLGELLGASITERPGDSWHPDARYFEVRDTATGKVLGGFFLDLYAREGKYGHAATLTLVQGRQTPDGYRMPRSAVIVNFAPPAAGQQAYLTHDDVVTLFHELGHALHETLTQGRFAQFSGTNVATDFAEAPSQMFEELAWRPEVLERLSRHPQTGKPLPKETIDRLAASRRFHSALEAVKTAARAAFDLALHSENVEELTELWRKIFTEFGYIAPTPGVSYPARFEHAIDGYDARYASYLISEYLARAMFAKFEKEGVLNPNVWRTWRNQVLLPGDGDERGNARRFLEEEPSEAPFWNSF